MYENKRTYEKIAGFLLKCMSLNSGYLSHRGGAQKRGEIEMGGSSHDVIENKRSASDDPTMFMKTNNLNHLPHDVYEKKGGYRLGTNALARNALTTEMHARWLAIQKPRGKKGASPPEK